MHEVRKTGMLEGVICLKPQTERTTYTVKEMAKVLGISMPTAYNLVNSQGFPKIRIGRKIIVPVEGLKEWIRKEAHA